MLGLFIVCVSVCAGDGRGGEARLEGRESAALIHVDLL